LREELDIVIDIIWAKVSKNLSESIFDIQLAFYSWLNLLDRFSNIHPDIRDWVLLESYYNWQEHATNYIRGQNRR
jgi:hypothetical protein